MYSKCNTLFVKLSPKSFLKKSSSDPFITNLILNPVQNILNSTSDIETTNDFLLRSNSIPNVVIPTFNSGHVFCSQPPVTDVIHSGSGKWEQLISRSFSQDKSNSWNKNNVLENTVKNQPVTSGVRASNNSSIALYRDQNKDLTRNRDQDTKRRAVTVKKLRDNLQEETVTVTVTATIPNKLPGDKPFICKWCLKEFSSESSLGHHIRSFHECQPFTCQVCHKSFRYRSQLELHESSHSDSRPFRCPYPRCTKAYKRSHDLEYHKKRCKHFVQIPNRDSKSGFKSNISLSTPAANMEDIDGDDGSSLGGGLNESLQQQKLPNCIINPTTSAETSLVPVPSLDSRSRKYILFTKARLHRTKVLIFRLLTRIFVFFYKLFRR